MPLDCRKPVKRRRMNEQQQQPPPPQPASDDELPGTDTQCAAIAQRLAAASQLAEPAARPFQSAQQPAATLSACSSRSSSTRLFQEMERLQSLRAVKADSIWDLFFPELQNMMLDFAGPLTRFLCGRLDAAKMDDAAKQAVWVDAFKQDWHGDLFLLPDIELEVEDLAHVQSRNMYSRLCELFPDSDSDSDDKQPYVRCVPLMRMWLDCLPSESSVDLGVRAVKGNCVAFLQYLLDGKHVEIKQLDDVVKNDKDNASQDSILDLAANEGRLEMVQFLLSQDDVECTPRVMDCAAFSGNLDLIKWLHANRHEGCTVFAMNFAALVGNLEVIKWLHANRTEGCTIVAMDWAAQFGHLHVVKWLHANRTEGCSRQAIGWAAKSGHAHVVKWLLANRKEGFTYHAIVNAKTHEIATLLVESLPDWEREEMIEAIIQTGCSQAIARISYF